MCFIFNININNSNKNNLPLHSDKEHHGVANENVQGVIFFDLKNNG